MILCSVEVTGALRGRDRSTSTWEHMELQKSLENQSEDTQCREESGHSGGGGNNNPREGSFEKARW